MMNVKCLKKDSKKIMYSIGSQKFQLILPTRMNNKYIVRPSGILDGYEWLYQINKSIDCDTTIETILDFVNQGYLKNNQANKSDPCSNKCINSSSGAEELDNIEQFIEYRKKLDKKYQNISNQEKNDKNQIFSNHESNQILLNEYFNLSKKYSDVKISLIDDDIYVWNLKFIKLNGLDNTIQLKKLQELCGYQHVEINLKFNQKLYPNYPPYVELVRPMITNNFMFKLTQLKMINIEYWTPCRSIKFIINKLQTILEKNLNIDFNSQSNKLDSNNISHAQLEFLIAKLKSLTDKCVDTLDDEEYVKINNIINNPSKYKDTSSSHKSDKTVWGSGIGFGSNNKKDWDPEDYIKMCDERNNQIKEIFSNINIYLKTHKSESCFNTISSSIVIPFLISHLDNYKDIGFDIEAYKLMIELLIIASCEEGLIIFTSQKNLLYNKLKNTYQNIINTKKITDKINDQNDSIIDDICISLVQIFSSIDTFIKKTSIKNERSKKSGKKNNKQTSKVKNVVDIYPKKMEQYRFTDCQFDARFSFEINSLEASRKCATRLRREMPLLNELPINYNSSIFVRIDEDNVTKMKVLVTGPDDTPYDSGCFIFDVHTPSNYPSGHPKMLFVNHGTKRFNPNLYACGKVCLSLLGTWGDQWNSKTSTLSQLFISVQAQILVENPYFNEPGYEKYTGNQDKKKSEAYNDNIRVYTAQHAIYELLDYPDAYPEFKDVIIKHFKLKRKYINNMLHKWTNMSSDQNKNKMANLEEKINAKLNAL